MTTSIHIPKHLLEAVERKARALRVSRNQLIVRVLENALAPRAEWFPGFFDSLRDVDAETCRAVDDMLVAIRAARRSKRPRSL